MTEEKKAWYEGIPAPVDADGNVVPLTTRTLYDGEGYEHEVKEIALVRSETVGGFVWLAKQPDGVVLVPELLHLERPDTTDTWERLEEDIESMLREHSACYYFGHGQDIPCHACPADNLEKTCHAATARDILRRTKALAGRGEDQ